MLKKTRLRTFNPNNSEKHRLSIEDIFCGTLDIYMKKMNPPSAVLGGRVHGKVCWLIAYNICCTVVRNKNNNGNSNLLILAL